MIYMERYRTMASTWLRIHMNSLGSIRISRLVTPLVLLAVVYLVFRLVRGPSRGIIHFKDVPPEHRMMDDEINSYLAALDDTRPEQCRLDYHTRLLDRRPSVSILVSFTDDEFYNLKLTLSSIIAHTPEEHYSEIVLLDDGSGHLHVREHAAEFIRSEKYSKLRAFRSGEQEGEGVTRFKAAQVAKGEVLVFVSSDTVVNQGWLDPLLVALKENPYRAVVPHTDNFLSDRRFFQMDDRLVPTFSWPLSTVYAESNEENGKYLRAPVIRGDVIAIKKEFLNEIGSYDDRMSVGGGSNMELSLRIWMCGGEILVSVCSRVATHTALKPLDVTSEANFRRIAELWLGDYKSIAYKQGKKESVPETQDETDSLLVRKGQIKKLLNCKNFDWYLNEVAFGVQAPSEGMVRYGKLKALSAYCALTVPSATDSSKSDIDVVLCRPFMYDPSMMFELDTGGRIRKGDLCLTVSDVTDRVVLMSCHEGAREQEWDLSLSGRLSNRGYPELCLSHVTERVAHRNHEHTMKIRACGESDDDLRKQTWTFISY